MSPAILFSSSFSIPGGKLGFVRLLLTPNISLNPTEPQLQDAKLTLPKWFKVISFQKLTGSAPNIASTG